MAEKEALAQETCPYCKVGKIEHHEADVGVGVIQGPAFCLDCGWSEPQPDFGMIEVDDDEPFDPAWTQEGKYK